MLLYSWSSSHDSITATSPITAETYTHAPPHFYFCDVSSLRLADYIGDYGGDLNRVGTIPDTVGYEAKGGITPWAYGADVFSNPAEDSYVKDETFGNYPGSGIHWVTPEWSYTKNEKESTYGGDTKEGYGQEIRRYCLHQTDLAQPSVRWMNSVPTNNSVRYKNESISFRWQVNGSLVVDKTSLHWTYDNGLNTTVHKSENLISHMGAYLGGTGWDQANNGEIQGVTYEKSIHFDKPGDYYIYAKAMVDQIYRNVTHAEVYGDESYLRLIQERVNESYDETCNGTDGVEQIKGSRWWYSPVVHVTVVDKELPSFYITSPRQGVYVNNKKILDLPFDTPIIFGDINLSVAVSFNDSIIQNMSFYVDNCLVDVDYDFPYSFSYDDFSFGMHTVKVIVFCKYDVMLTKKLTICKFF
jgi:hypothetical protein